MQCRASACLEPEDLIEALLCPTGSRQPRDKQTDILAKSLAGKLLTKLQNLTLMFERHQHANRRLFEERQRGFFAIKTSSVQHTSLPPIEPPTPIREIPATKPLPIVAEQHAKPPKSLKWRDAEVSRTGAHRESGSPHEPRPPAAPRTQTSQTGPREERKPVTQTDSGASLPRVQSSPRSEDDDNHSDDDSRSTPPALRTPEQKTGPGYSAAEW